KDLHHPLLAVHEDHVDRDAHEEGVDAVAGRYPHPAFRRQAAPEHQPQSAAHEGSRPLQPGGQHPSAGRVHQAERRLTAGRHGNAIPYRAMPDFDSDGVRLRYLTVGPETGRPIVLVHGFCSDYELNWVGSRWQETMVGAGRRVLGLDCRGHGHSDKPHDPAAYRLATMAADVVRLLDHLDVQVADFLGYSMGARIGLEAAARHADRMGRAVLGGLGMLG